MKPSETVGDEKLDGYLPFFSQQVHFPSMNSVPLSFHSEPSDEILANIPLIFLGLSAHSHICIFNILLKYTV